MCWGVRNAWVAFGLLVNWLGREQAGVLEDLQGVRGEMRDLQLGLRCTLSCISTGLKNLTVFGVCEALVTFNLHEGAASEDNNVALRYC